MFIKQLFITSRAASCFSLVTPAQQSALTLIVKAGRIAFNIRALLITQISVQVPQKVTSSNCPNASKWSAS